MLQYAVSSARALEEGEPYTVNESATIVKHFDRSGIIFCCKVSKGAWAFFSKVIECSNEAGPLEAILVIFGRRDLIFFV